MPIALTAYKYVPNKGYVLSKHYFHYDTYFMTIMVY